jgi:hypothetical protein
MSLAKQKFLAVGGLGAGIGFIVGCLVAPYATAPIDPDMMECGLPVLAQSAIGGIAGAGLGSVFGLALAWWLPTPRERTEEAVS